ncbi:Carbohydrate binding 6 [Umbelopsis sp. WA50703]
MTRTFVKASLLLAGLATTVMADIPAATNGFSLIWGDDFVGPANTAPDSGKWQYDLGGGYPGGAPNWGTGEVQQATNNIANSFQDGSGNLKIVPIRDDHGGWTSARLESIRDDFQAPPGGVLAVEARMQLPDVSGPAAAGYWPAFWMLGAPYRGNYNNWPNIGEFDIMENVNGLNCVWGTLHSAANPGSNQDREFGSKLLDISPSIQSAFHTYRFELDNAVKEMKWYVDGKQYFSVSSSQLSAQTWTDVTNHGAFIILDVAIGGNMPAGMGGGPTSATQSGVPLTVDYVAVYQKKP